MEPTKARLLLFFSLLLGIALGMDFKKRKKGPKFLSNPLFLLFGVPTGSRTPVTGVKGPCPRPLDDGDVFGPLSRIEVYIL